MQRSIEFGTATALFQYSKFMCLAVEHFEIQNRTKPLLINYVSLLCANVLFIEFKLFCLFCVKYVAFFPNRAWNHCDAVQDYLSIFDGKSTDFPELARICGGDSLPDIISSGPDMLIVFQTSPFDSLFHPTPMSYLLGFELQVEVSPFLFCNYMQNHQTTFCINTFCVYCCLLIYWYCNRLF